MAELILSKSLSPGFILLLSKKGRSFILTTSSYIKPATFFLVSIPLWFMKTSHGVRYRTMWRQKFLASTERCMAARRSYCNIQTFWFNFFFFFSYIAFSISRWDWTSLIVGDYIGGVRSSGYEGSLYIPCLGNELWKYQVLGLTGRMSKILRNFFDYLCNI